MHDLSHFLEPAPGIQCSAPEIFSLARETAKGSANDIQAAKRLFEFARDTVAYSVYVPFESLDDYLALNTLKRGRGYCVQKAALLCALARSVGIPSRLGFADIKNHQLPERLDRMIPDGVIYFHCFVEWWLKDRWLKATPAFDRTLCEKKGWRVVEFTAGQDALLPATDLLGRPHVEYLNYHGWRQGVPLEEFIDHNTRACGKEAMDLWRQAGREAVA